MRCPHCVTEIHLTIQISDPILDATARPKIRAWDVSFGLCPACDKPIVFLRYGTSMQMMRIVEEKLVYPQTTQRPALVPEIPEWARQDFEEAAAIVKISPRASAALSRRTLQTILREVHGIEKRSLSEEIAAFINDSGVPSDIADAIDAVRVIGNFAAHPVKDATTGEISEVEPEEAEWLLDVLEALFDYSFVQPKKLKARQEKLDKKLVAMGKSPTRKRSTNEKKL